MNVLGLNIFEPSVDEIILERRPPKSKTSLSDPQHASGRLGSPVRCDTRATEAVTGNKTPGPAGSCKRPAQGGGSPLAPLQGKPGTRWTVRVRQGCIFQFMPITSAPDVRRTGDMSTRGGYRSCRPMQHSRLREPSCGKGRLAAVSGTILRLSVWRAL